MKRGRKFSVAECNKLIDAGIDNPRDYLYIKTEFVDAEGSKNVGKSREHDEVMIIQERRTGMIKRVTIF